MKIERNGKLVNWIDLNTKFAFTQDYNIECYDLQALKNSIMNILKIKVTELMGKPEFGNPVDQYLFHLITPELNLAFEEDLRMILRKFEPRIRVESAELIENPDYHEVQCSVNFWIVDDPNEELFNLKTSFYKFEN